MSTTKKVSAYKLNVLNTNKALKQERKSLGGAVRILWLFREEIKLSKEYVQILSVIRENNEVYASFKENVRVSKAGNYSPFFVLQAIHKALKNEVAESSRQLKKLDDLTKAQLQELATKNNVKFTKSMNKTELKSLIMA